ATWNLVRQHTYRFTPLQSPYKRSNPVHGGRHGLQSRDVAGVLHDGFQTGKPRWAIHDRDRPIFNHVARGDFETTEVGSQIKYTAPLCQRVLHQRLLITETPLQTFFSAQP